MREIASQFGAQHKNLAPGALHEGIAPRALHGGLAHGARYWCGCYKWNVLNGSVVWCGAVRVAWRVQTGPDNPLPAFKWNRVQGESSARGAWVRPSPPATTRHQSVDHQPMVMHSERSGADGKVGAGVVGVWRAGGYQCGWSIGVYTHCGLRVVVLRFGACTCAIVHKPCTPLRINHVHQLSSCPDLYRSPP
jgi:hypothetical protein